MFSPEHAIWQFANAGDEIEDWLPYAEDLIRIWSTQNSDDVKFATTFEIILAAYLLKDGFLPESASTALGELVLKTIDEVHSKKLGIKCLMIYPPAAGRKKNRTQPFIRFHEVDDLIREGKTATEAYAIVAEKHFKSPDTIRRDYERIVAKMRKRKAAGEIDR